MKRSKVMLLALAFTCALCVGETQARTISENMVLDQDTDWTNDGVVTVEEGVTLDLAGHKLTVAGLAGAGSVTSSVAAVYQRLDYLQSDGNSYINTGYIPVSATSADLRLRFVGNLPANNYTWKSVFGTRKSGSNASFFGVFVYRQNGNVYFWKSLRGDQDKCVTDTGVVTTNVDYYLQLDKDGNSTINGRRFGDGLAGNCVYPALLFAMNQDGENAPWEGASAAAAMRLYYCRFVENGTVKHDFIPAKRLSDGVLGMYDRSTGEFKTNAGAGGFTGGSVRDERSFATGELHLAAASCSSWNCSQIKVASTVAVVADGGMLAADADWRALGTIYTTAGEVLDLGGRTLKVTGIGGSGTITDDVGSEYEYLDYIQGSGTQYINTGYTMGSDTKADFKVQFVGLPASGKWHGVFGMRSTDNMNIGACVFLYNNAGTVNFWRTLNGDANVPTLGTVATDVDYAFHIDKTGTGPSTITGGSLDHATLGTALGGTCAGSAYIFNLNQNGAVWSVNESARMRLYSFSFSENGTVVRDYLPVRRKMDNAVGLYDRIERVFHGNSGTGAFLAGTVTNSATQVTASELYIEVPEGVELENRDVSILGNVKLVKDGPGVFIPSKSRQYYTGGTRVAAGEFRIATCNYEIDRADIMYYGAEGSEVTVSEGALLNFDGNGNHHLLKFVLDGGEIRSAASHGMEGHAWIGDLRLTADSKISGYDFGFVQSGAVAMSVDLGGHTLTLDVTPSQIFYAANTTFTGGGRLVANTGGWIDLCKHDKPSTFDVDTTFEPRGTAIRAALPVVVAGIYESSCSQTFDEGAGVMQVTGRFRPNSTLFRSVLLKNGSTLDLNQQSGIFTVPCYFSSSRCYGTLAFESNAVVTVDISTRRPALYEKLVSWSERQPPVTFKFDDVTATDGVPAIATANGLYYGADPASRVVDQAWWTGAAGDGDVANPANWACTNATGHVVNEGLPGELAAVHVTGEVSLQIPQGKTLSFNTIDLDGVRLAADCDWRGLGTTAVFYGTLDLAGHSLTVSGLGGPGTITDTTKGYVALEYLQSQSDGNQYIDTEVVHDQTTQVDLKVQFGSLPGRYDWYSYFGARTGNSTDSQFGAWLYNSNGTTYHYSGVKANENAVTALGAVNTATIYDVHLAKNGPCTVNGGALDTGSGYSCGTSLLLFCIRNGNSLWSAPLVKIYSCAIYHNGAWVRNFKPVRRLSDGALGMYDTVHDKFYPNAGTGEFVPGALAFDERFAATGRLIIDVPEGQTVTASTVNLSGGLKLVKRGAGTFIANTANQSYIGGNLIENGQITLGNPTALATTAPVEVATNGVLEVNGVYACYCQIILNGGTLQNTTADVGANNAQVAQMKLAAESTFVPTRSYGFIGHDYTQCMLDLGGKTLAVDLALGKSFYLVNTLVTNGVVDIRSGGWTQIGVVGNAAGVDARTADFRIGSALNVIRPFDVHGYEAVYDNNENAGTAAMNVYGWFKPTTAYFYGCTLQDGAMLDLSAQRGTWSTTSAFTSGANQVSFASGAHITIGLADRVLPPGGKIVDWTDNAPTNLTSLTFNIDAEGKRRGRWLTVKPDEGIYVNGGMVLFLR